MRTWLAETVPGLLVALGSGAGLLFVAVLTRMGRRALRRADPMPSSLRLWWDCGLLRYWLVGEQQVYPRTRAEERARREAIGRPVVHYGAEDTEETSEWFREVADGPVEVLARLSLECELAPSPDNELHAGCDGTGCGCACHAPDCWDVLLAEFNANLTVELASHDERFFTAIAREVNPDMAALVRGDKTTTGEMWRIVDGSFESTQELSVVGAG
jgi:hypothetical protein